MKPRLMIAAILLCTASALSSAGTGRPNASGPDSDDAAIAHVLNRIGYGPKPGQIETVRQIGLARYIDRQLHPERISDAGMIARLDGLPTLSLSAREIAERYEQPLLQERAQQRREAGKPATGGPAADPRSGKAEAQQANLPLVELSEQTILRSVYSERQLEEVLTDFWFNHFNVDARKGPVRFMLTSYERDTIRPHVLGHFRDLLGATARSPAMLFYLDNWMSTDPNGPHRDPRRERRAAGAERRQSAGLGMPVPQTPAQTRNARRGLNENYGRELLELHTLGVDGGYTQHDVTEVARAFTGWTIDRPREGGGFRFVPQLHDDGEKIVLGQRIAAGGGERDGERVLDILAAHPATARSIATKLAVRFVSDTPPADLVARLSATFLSTHGDLQAIMRALLTSPEFLSPDAHRAKVKTPVEFVVSALRASGAEIADARSVVRSLQQLGMPLYQCQPPTGYKTTADAWVNTGALVNRMNVALALAGGSMKGVMVPHTADATSLIAGTISDTTRATIARAANGSQATALALGSPEFQRR